MAEDIIMSDADDEFPPSSQHSDDFLPPTFDASDLLTAPLSSALSEPHPYNAVLPWHHIWGGHAEGENYKAFKDLCIDAQALRVAHPPTGPSQPGVDAPTPAVDAIPLRKHKVHDKLFSKCFQQLRAPKEPKNPTAEALGIEERFMAWAIVVTTVEKELPKKHTVSNTWVHNNARNPAKRMQIFRFFHAMSQADIALVQEALLRLCERIAAGPGFYDARTFPMVSQAALDNANLSIGLQIPLPYISKIGQSRTITMTAHIIDPQTGKTETFLKKPVTALFANSTVQIHAARRFSAPNNPPNPSTPDDEALQRRGMINMHWICSKLEGKVCTLEAAELYYKSCLEILGVREATDKVSIGTGESLYSSGALFTLTTSESGYRIRPSQTLAKDIEPFCMNTISLPESPDATYRVLELGMRYWQLSGDILWTFEAMAIRADVEILLWETAESMPGPCQCENKLLKTHLCTNCRKLTVCLHLEPDAEGRLLCPECISGEQDVRVKRRRKRNNNSCSYCQEHPDPENPCNRLGPCSRCEELHLVCDYYRADDCTPCQDMQNPDAEHPCDRLKPCQPCVESGTACTYEVPARRQDCTPCQQNPDANLPCDRRKPCLPCAESDTACIYEAPARRQDCTPCQQNPAINLPCDKLKPCLPCVESGTYCTYSEAKKVTEDCTPCQQNPDPSHSCSRSRPCLRCQDSGIECVYQSDHLSRLHGIFANALSKHIRQLEKHGHAKLAADTRQGRNEIWSNFLRESGLDDPTVAPTSYYGATLDVSLPRPDIFAVQLDAIEPITVITDEEGRRITASHAPGNFKACLALENCLKWVHGKLLLPLFAELCQLPDESRRQYLHRCIDHLYLISLQMPYSTEERLQLDPEKVDAIRQQLSRCAVDPDEADSTFQPWRISNSCYATSARGVPGAERIANGKEDFPDLDTIIEFMVTFGEQNGEDYNTDDVPYLFNPANKPIFWDW